MSDNESYYRSTLTKLIEKYKIAIEQCLKIVGQPVDQDLKDDKLHNVLKAKKMAAEDAKFYATEIDKIENELAGKVVEDPKEPEAQKTWSKKVAATK